MATLADANLIVQARLRALLAAAITAVWRSLPGYDRANVDQWLTAVLPAVEAAQRRSVALTDAYIARALERPPLGIDATRLIGSAIRGTSMETVYTRPFVTTWSALSNGTEWETAVAEGLHRAASTAETDVQLSHLRTYNAIAALDDRIVGYQRVPDASACEFCRLIAGRRYHAQMLQPAHPHCGCGVEPITEANRDDFTGKRENDIVHEPLPDGVAVHEHGELGPVLGDPAHHFQSDQDF